MSLAARTRPVALVVVRRGESLLVSEGSGYRPLGGEVRPGEHSDDAARRVVREAIDAEVRELVPLGALEDGRALVHEASLDDARRYDDERFELADGSRLSWVAPPGDGRLLHPEGLLELLPPPVALKARGIVRTPGGNVLLIRRRRPGEEPYWTLPGGRVEPDDETARAALARELLEELGGEARVGALVDDLDDGHEDAKGRRVRTLTYEATIEHWDEAKRTGPEFRKPSKGSYDLEEREPDPAVLGALPFRPPAHAGLLRQVLG